MNKKSKMITAVMLLAVSAAGLILINYYNPQQEQQELETPPGNPVEQAADSCENFTDIEKAKCYLDKDDLNASLEVCGNLSGGDRNLCYQRIAVTITDKNISNLNESFGLCNNMTSGRFTCYTSLASTIVTSDADAAISLCNLTSPRQLCYKSIGYVIARRGINETIAVCRKIKDSSCFTPAAVFMAGNDSESAVFICRECVNTTDTECLACYFGVSEAVVHYESRKAVDICSEAAAVADKYSDSFPYMCQMNAAEAIREINASASFEVCGNLTGRMEASCYFRIIPFSNNTAHITEMCGCMIDEYGEDPNIMRYCKNYT